jgi:hypothetical protein
MRNITDKLFKDRNGKFIIYQKPNLPLIAWFFCYALANLVNNNNLSLKLTELATLFIALWAYLELNYGVTLFRKIIGVIVFSIVVINILLR